MSNVITRLQEKDPSRVNGWLISVLNTVAAFLVTLQPELDGITGWQNAAIVVFAALMPHVQAILTALNAYKPSTVAAIRATAKAAGKEEAEAQATLMRSEAARKGRAKRSVSSDSTQVPEQPKPTTASKRSKVASSKK